MEPADADAYFGRVTAATSPAARVAIALAGVRAAGTMIRNMLRRRRTA